jgi:DNA repair protein RadA/Sms
VKWVGQCPSCNQWNTFVEELTQKDNSKKDNSWKDYHDEKRTSKTLKAVKKKDYQHLMLN